MVSSEGNFYFSVIPLIAINGAFILGYVIFMLMGKNAKRHQELSKR